MKRFSLLLLLPFLAACSSAPPPGQRVNMQPASDQGFGSGAGLGLESIPLADWWHDAQLSKAASVTEAQSALLESIGRDSQYQLDQMRQDAIAASRNLRLIVDTEHPVEADVVEAGQRIRDARAKLLDRQMQLLAAERVVLSQEQWIALEAALRTRIESRSGTSRSNSNTGRRGRGGYGGGGAMGNPNWPNN